MYDIDEYSDNFGLFFDMREFSPFPKAFNEDELLNAILNIKIDEKEYREFVKNFMGYEDGHAAQKVIDEMLNIGGRND